MQIDFNTISFALAVISICLSVFALWQANEHKKSAEKSERGAQDALSEIKSEMKAIRDYAIPELKSYGDAMREFVFRARVRDAEQSFSPTQSPLSSVAPTPTPTPTPSATSTPTPSASTKKNLRVDILSTIRELTARDGKAPAMNLTDALKEKYDFGLIYGELLMLRQEGIITWQGDQDTPQPFAGIEIAQNH